MLDSSGLLDHPINSYPAAILVVRALPSAFLYQIQTISAIISILYASQIVSLEKHNGQLDSYLILKTVI
jgi:hypothetical protein